MPEEPPPKPQIARKKLALFTALGATLAFFAGILANLQSIIDFWNRHISPPDPKYELKAFPNGADAQPVPPDEPLPPDLRNVTNPQSFNIEMKGLDRPGLQSEEYAYKFNSDNALNPTFEGIYAAAVTQPQREARAGTASPVIVEAVQSPRQQQLYDLWFDVFLRNGSDEDLLFVSVAYVSRVDWARGGGEDSGAMLPNMLYQIPYSLGGRGTIALGPPYRLGRRSRGAIRFRFHPTNQTETDMGLSHWLDVWIIDSSGRSRKIIRFPAP